MEIAEAYEDMMTVQGFKTIAKTILMVKVVVGVEWKPAAWVQCHQLPPSSELYDDCSVPNHSLYKLTRPFKELIL